MCILYLLIGYFIGYIHSYSRAVLFIGKWFRNLFEVRERIITFVGLLPIHVKFVTKHTDKQSLGRVWERRSHAFPLKNALLSAQELLFFEVEIITKGLDCHS